MSGWIKLHRKILQNDMYQQLNSKQRDVLITVLLMANYEESEWEYAGEIYKCKPGQFVTSLKSIQQNCASDVSIQNIRTALDKFKKWGFLTWEPTNKNRKITITNWEMYQGEADETNKQSNKESNKPLTSEEQPEEKEKDGQEKPSRECVYQYNNEFEQLWKEYPNKKGKAKARQAYKKHRKSYSFEEIRAALERYKEEIKRKETPQQYIKHGSTFFNSGFEDYLEENDGEIVQVEPRRLEMPGMDFLQRKLEEAVANL
jgi:hypothetical protein